MKAGGGDCKRVKDGGSGNSAVKVLLVVAALTLVVVLVAWVRNYKKIYDLKSYF